jgi:6-phosphogluconate dehydrogenase (decarboxylating)
MKVGFIGVGNMGGPMCRNIIRNTNHEVIVFDLSPGAVNYANLAGFLLPPLCTPDRKWFSLAADAPA